MKILKMTFKLCFLLLFIASANCSCPRIITRAQWNAESPKNSQNLSQNPPPWVVVHHSDTPKCNSEADCKTRVKNIQHFHMHDPTRQWADIGYNFLIGGDGNVYEGRGWGKTGAHLPYYNSKSIGICLIGTYQNEKPSNLMMQTLKKLIACGVENGKISGSYKLIGHRQAKDTDCPGQKLYDEIKTWPHFDKSPPARP